MTTVTASKKKDFIKWFLRHYQLKKRESVWILNYLREDDNLLNKIHFVENLKGKEKGIVMTTQCTDGHPFTFSLNGTITVDPEKAFHNIRSNQNEDVYIVLAFHNRLLTKEFLEVLEDETDGLQESKKSEKQVFGGKYVKPVNDIVEYVEYQFQTNLLNMQINQALDNNDKELFMRLTNELNSLNKVIKPYTTYRK